MLLNVVNYLNNMDKNSRFLLIIIGIISFLLILIYIINFISGSSERKRKVQNKKLVEEINKAAKEIKAVPKKTSPATQNIAVKKEEVEVLDVEEEVIEILQDDSESDVDRIIKDIKKATKDDTMNLTEFEKEQEETAIISYDELCKRAGVKKKVYKAVTEETVDITNIINNTEEKKKFKATKYVSPIFGVQDDKKQEEDLDKTFLQNLKEFRSTLDV